MAVDDVLLQGRAAFAALLTDTCRITKSGVGKGPFNETTGKYDPPDRVLVYEGPCRLQVKVDLNSNVIETTAGEREWTYTTSQLQLPVITPGDAVGSVDAIDVDHVAEILTSAYSLPLVGHQFNIQNRIGPKSHEIYARYRVREAVA